MWPIISIKSGDKDDVKTQVMADFAGGETPILVSTTVIEVGVDVKQAMIKALEEKNDGKFDYVGPDQEMTWAR